MSAALLALSLITLDTNQTRFAKEAARLTQKTISTFYDPTDQIWKPPVASSEAVDVQGYTFWPSLLAWQVIIEAAKVDPKKWKPRIAPFYKTLEQYFDKSGHAYCAWKYFVGNDDKFYDDNTWASVACSEAFEVTGDVKYKTRAREIFDGFVKGGWDNTGSPGGLRWGTKAGIEDRSDRTVSATAAGALAALLIAKNEHDADMREWSKRALNWIHDKLSSSDGLIYDGFKAPSFTRMPTIWTYNTGVPIRAAIEYSKQTGDTTYLAWATKMGDTCINKSESPMYDGAVKNLSRRYWYDSTFFVQYLVDGMRALSLATGKDKYLSEARREADYVSEFLRDQDGLYWRNMRMWTINPNREVAFQVLTRQSMPPLNPDASERSMDKLEVSKPVEERKMVKTLLANAGVARMFWLLAH